MKRKIIKLLIIVAIVIGLFLHIYFVIRSHRIADIVMHNVNYNTIDWELFEVELEE